MSTGQQPAQPGSEEVKRFEFVGRHMVEVAPGTTCGGTPFVMAADYDRLQSALTAAQQRIRELESLNAERNRQNAAAFEERDELQRQIERYAWLVKHGESYFGSLWREATGADIDVGMAAGREQT